MPLTLLMYPHGYVTKHETRTAFTGESFGDEGVSELYDRFTARQSLSYDWSYISAVIKRATSLIGDDFNRWLKIQTPNNPYVYGVNRDFLEDTVNYIRTGTRRMPIHLWRELLVEKPRERSAVESTVKYTPIVPLDRGADYIGCWLSHPDGLSDLICTLHILFGYTVESRHREAEASRPRS